jgi:hypothetical protein
MTKNQSNQRLILFLIILVCLDYSFNPHRHYFKKNVDSRERVFLYKRGQFQFGERVKHFLPSGNTALDSSTAPEGQW